MKYIPMDYSIIFFFSSQGMNCQRSLSNHNVKIIALEVEILNLKNVSQQTYWHKRNQ